MQLTKKGLSVIDVFSVETDFNGFLKKARTLSLIFKMITFVQCMFLSSQKSVLWK